MQKLDWHLNCSWMSQFLTFKDLNALSLASKELGESANAARMLKVNEWEETSNEGERVWIEHYKRNYPKIINPASLYLKCLRYRHICADHFREIVMKDPRLTARQKKELVTLESPSKLFYWFVVDVLPQRPLKINFSLNLLKNALTLPYGQEIIRRTILGRVFLFFNARGNIVLSNEEGLLGVVTRDDHLWPTGKWSEAHSEFLNSLCMSTPAKIITEYSRTCPFCGMDVAAPCSHSMRCMMNYARWSSGMSVGIVELLSK